MGSIGAMQAGSKDRYFQEDADEVSKLVPRDRGEVPYKGSLSAMIPSSSAASAPAWPDRIGTIEDLRTKSQFVRITAAGLRESHAHDVVITKKRLTTGSNRRTEATELPADWVGRGLFPRRHFRVWTARAWAAPHQRRKSVRDPVLTLGKAEHHQQRHTTGHDHYAALRTAL